MPIRHAADAMVNYNPELGGRNNIREHYIPPAKKALPLASAVSAALEAASSYGGGQRHGSNEGTTSALRKGSNYLLRTHASSYQGATYAETNAKT